MIDWSKVIENYVQLRAIYKPVCERTWFKYIMLHQTFAMFNDTLLSYGKLVILKQFQNYYRKINKLIQYTFLNNLCIEKTAKKYKVAYLKYNNYTINILLNIYTYIYIVPVNI